MSKVSQQSIARWRKPFFYRHIHHHIISFYQPCRLGSTAFNLPSTRSRIRKLHNRLSVNLHVHPTTLRSTYLGASRLQPPLHNQIYQFHQLLHKHCRRVRQPPNPNSTSKASGDLTDPAPEHSTDGHPLPNSVSRPPDLSPKFSNPPWITMAVTRCPPRSWRKAMRSLSTPRRQYRPTNW